MSVKMYLSWRTKQRKFSPLGAKHHFLLLFCPPVRLHLHKREMGLLKATRNCTSWCCPTSGPVHKTVEKFEIAAFFPMIRPTVHTNLTRKRSFSKTLFKREEI